MLKKRGGKHCCCCCNWPAIWKALSNVFVICLTTIIQTIFNIGYSIGNRLCPKVVPEGKSPIAVGFATTKEAPLKELKPSSFWFLFSRTAPQIPKINGTYLRMNLGGFQLGNNAFLHWLDGMAMVHGFYFKDGKVLYQSKFLDAEYIESAKRANGLTRILFKTTPANAYIIDPNDTVQRDHQFNLADESSLRTAALFDRHLDMKNTTNHSPVLQKLADDIHKELHARQVQGQSPYDNDSLSTTSSLNGSGPRNDANDGDDPDFVSGKDRWLYRYANQTNVTFCFAGETLLATTDNPIYTKLDPHSLKTLQCPYVWNDNIERTFQTMSETGSIDCLSPAHPAYDQQTGYYYNIFLRNTVGPKGFSIVLYQWNSETREVIAEMELPAGTSPYTHQIAVTENYVIVPLSPMNFGILGVFASQPPLECFVGNVPGATTIIYIFTKPKNGEKQSTLVRQFKCDDFFYFHLLNCYEEGNDVIVDFQSYPDTSMIFNLYLAKLRNNGNEFVNKFLKNGEIIRCTCDLSGNATVAEIKRCKPYMEFGRINDNYNMKKYRYAYGLGLKSVNTALFMGENLIKVDMWSAFGKNNERKCDMASFIEWHSIGCYSSEPMFIPCEMPPLPSSRSCDDASEDDKEDEGVLLSIILNILTKNSFLLVLDARTMKEIVRYDLPETVPFGTHGIFTETYYDPTVPLSRKNTVLPEEEQEDETTILLEDNDVDKDQATSSLSKRK